MNGVVGRDDIEIYRVLDTKNEEIDVLDVVDGHQMRENVEHGPMRLCLLSSWPMLSRPVLATLKLVFLHDVRYSIIR